MRIVIGSIKPFRKQFRIDLCLRKVNSKTTSGRSYRPIH
jgi:hypothetical protein